jgi:hypothetical protein
MFRETDIRVSDAMQPVALPVLIFSFFTLLNWLIILCFILKKSTLKSEDFRLRDPEYVNAVKWGLKNREFIKSRVIYRRSLCYQDRVLNECRLTCNISMVLDPRKKLEKNFKQENCQLMLEPTE